MAGRTKHGHQDKNRISSSLYSQIFSPCSFLTRNLFFVKYLLHQIAFQWATIVFLLDFITFRKFHFQYLLH